MKDPLPAHLEFVQGFPETVKCCVCLEPWNDPIELFPCGHILCRSHLAQLEDEENAFTKCPECRQGVNGTVGVHRSIMNVVKELHVECTRCGWRGRREGCSKHRCDYSVKDIERIGEMCDLKKGKEDQFLITLCIKKCLEDNGGGGGDSGYYGNDGNAAIKSTSLISPSIAQLPPTSPGNIISSSSSTLRRFSDALSLDSLLAVTESIRNVPEDLRMDIVHRLCEHSDDYRSHLIPILSHIGSLFEVYDEKIRRMESCGMDTKKRDSKQHDLLPVDYCARHQLGIADLPSSQIVDSNNNIHHHGSGLVYHGETNAGNGDVNYDQEHYRHKQQETQTCAIQQLHTTVLHLKKELSDAHRQVRKLKEEVTSLSDNLQIANEVISCQEDQFRQGLSLLATSTEEKLSLMHRYFTTSTMNRTSNQRSTQTSEPVVEKDYRDAQCGDDEDDHTVGPHTSVVVGVSIGIQTLLEDAHNDESSITTGVDPLMPSSCSSFASLNSAQLVEDSPRNLVELLQNKFKCEREANLSLQNSLTVSLNENRELTVKLCESLNKQNVLKQQYLIAAGKVNSWQSVLASKEKRLLKELSEIM